MIKTLFHRVPMMIKAAVFYVLIGGVFVGFLLFFIQEIQHFLQVNHQIDISFQTFVQLVPVHYYALGTGLVTLMWLIFVYDIRIFYRHIHALLIESLSDRKLPKDFPLFESGYTFKDIASHLTSILGLYKSFDTMKTARITLEVGCVKLLMNVVDEGVLLVNSDRVATHINHNGEQFLGLIPGEIIGEAISRKISNEIFLENLDQTFEFDQKCIGKNITFGDKTILLVSMFPVKDKFGDVVRALIVVRKNTKDQTDSKNKNNSEDS
jgi:hypothetical protein